MVIPQDFLLSRQQEHVPAVGDHHEISQPFGLHDFIEPLHLRVGAVGDEGLADAIEGEREVEGLRGFDEEIGRRGGRIEAWRKDLQVFHGFLP